LAFGGKGGERRAVANARFSACPKTGQETPPLTKNQPGASADTTQEEQQKHSSSNEKKKKEKKALSVSWKKEHKKTPTKRGETRLHN